MIDAVGLTRPDGPTTGPRVSRKGARVNVRIHARNTEIADDVRELAHEKVEHAGRIFDDVTNVDVEFSESGNPRQTDARYPR